MGKCSAAEKPVENRSSANSCCGFCNLNIISSSYISGSGYEEKFHAYTICLGIKESLINALLESSDGAINNYLCSFCSSSSRSELGRTGAVSRLLVVVGGMFAELRDLTATPHIVGGMVDGS